MKRTTKIILVRSKWDYITPSNSVALCHEFVNELLGESPNRIVVEVRAIPPTKPRTYRVGRRLVGSLIHLYGGAEWGYRFVHETLQDLGVNPGDKFWFKLTATK